MKKIECILPENKYHELEMSLRGYGVSGMTVTSVKGFGNEQTRPESFLLLPKIKVEVFCRDEDLDPIIDLITDTCRTGKLGSGKIAVYEILDLVRVRTGERGAVAV